MDVIRAYTIGVRNCVASLGTAFGKEQAMLIRKLSDNVILCFDGDDAGLKATKSAIVELEKLGITPKIVRLENNSDPDEYIIKNGKDSFINKINNPMNIMEFKESLLKKEYNLNNTEELATYINKMINEIDSMNDDILKEVSINKLSEETKVDISLLKSKLTKKEIKKEEIKPKKEIKLNKYIKSEKNLIYYMLISNDVIKMYEKKITHMPTDVYRHLAFQIDLFYKENGYINEADLITFLDNDIESIKVLGEITSLDLPNEVNYDEIEDYLNNIKEYNEKNQASIYKEKIKSEVDYKKKIELANKALEIRRRREEYDR